MTFVTYRGTFNIRLICEIVLVEVACSYRIATKVHRPDLPRPQDKERPHIPSCLRST